MAENLFDLLKKGEVEEFNSEVANFEEDQRDQRKYFCSELI